MSGPKTTARTCPLWPELDQLPIDDAPPEWAGQRVTNGAVEVFRPGRRWKVVRGRMMKCPMGHRHVMSVRLVPVP